MTAFVFANNLSTTLAAAASPTATTLTLASSANLPTLGTGQVMPFTLNDAATRQVFEIVYVTAISGATLTVTRGQEGTAAQSWSVGDYAYSAPTAGTVAPVDGNPNNAFEVADSASGTAEAVPRSQADTLYATLNGSLSEPFSAEQLTSQTMGTGNTAVPILYGFGNYGGNSNSAASSQNLGTSVTFTANEKCVVLVTANGGTGSGNVNGAGFNISGATLVQSESNWASGSQLSAGTALLSAAKGASVYIYWYTTCANASQITVGFTFVCIPTP